MDFFLGTNLSANECDPKLIISFNEFCLQDKHFFSNFHRFKYIYLKFYKFYLYH